MCVTLDRAVWAQESNNGKQLWAASYLNEKAPELVVEKWLTAKPDTKGKFVLIDFWATWCGPCRRFIPTLNQFQDKFRDRLVVIGLSDEPKEKVHAMATPVVQYAGAIDTKATTSHTMTIKGIPHAILIDPKGIVCWEGFPLLSGNELTENILQGLLEKYK